MARHSNPSETRVLAETLAPEWAQEVVKRRTLKKSGSELVKNFLSGAVNMTSVAMPTASRQADRFIKPLIGRMAARLIW